MKIMDKYLSLLLIVLLASCVSCSKEDAISVEPLSEHPIVVIYENDVHCAVDGYAKLVTVREEQRKLTPYATTVSCGDFVQGDIVGAVSTGGYIIDIMNEVDYDFVTLGNHEFDFGVPRMFELMEGLNAGVLNANFRDLRTNQTVFPACGMVRYEEVDIAYIGLTTTSTLSISPKKFQDGQGTFVYDFSKDRFYETAQRSIDEARRAGADYVVVLSHLGDVPEGDNPSSLSLIAQTAGIDVVLDGHSHSYIPDTLVRNALGEPVLLSSTGSKFEGLGILTLSPEGTFSTQVKPLEEVVPDAGVQAFVNEISAKVEAAGSNVLGYSEVSLATHDANGNQLVRNRETCIGNFCADAFRLVLDTDVAMINGGGIRDSISLGEVTFNDLMSVFPFGNTAVVASMTGRQLVDALEFSVKDVPVGFGEFMQVSGMKFEVNASIPSPVLMDGNGLFIGVQNAPRRISNLQILNDNNEYELVDPNREYTVSGFSYHLVEGGGQGILSGASIIGADMGQDIEILSVYMQQHLNGIIGHAYATTEGRISITEAACLEEP